MIRIVRGGEPASLGPIRTAQLTALRALGRPPNSKDIKGYKVVAVDLWRAQHYKCCYCEFKIPMGYNDVEHYRPKASADRRPGCLLRHGYWWLAFTWDNLLYSCPACNRSAKNDRFPMDHGSVSIHAESPEPGGELPLLLNPGELINPVEHIVFVLETVGPIGGPQQWWARPRNGSQFGHMTIDVCDLNRSELRELRSDYFDTTISPKVKALDKALATRQRKEVLREFSVALALLDSRVPYVAFAYDALRSSIPDAKLKTVVAMNWPAPSQVGV